MRGLCAKWDDTGGDDIMTDLWVGSQYILAQRNLTNAATQKAIDAINLKYGLDLHLGFYGEILEGPIAQEQKFNHWRIISDMEFYSEEKTK